MPATLRAPSSNVSARSSWTSVGELPPVAAVP
jgi:hypothetical protein